MSGSYRHGHLLAHTIALAETISMGFKAVIAVAEAHTKTSPTADEAAVDDEALGDILLQKELSPKIAPPTKRRR